MSTPSAQNQTQQESRLQDSDEPLVVIDKTIVAGDTFVKDLRPDAQSPEDDHDPR